MAYNRQYGGRIQKIPTENWVGVYLSKLYNHFTTQLKFWVLYQVQKIHFVSMEEKPSEKISYRKFFGI